MSASCICLHTVYLAAYFRKRTVFCACRESVESHDEALKSKSFYTLTPHLDRSEKDPGRRQNVQHLHDTLSLSS